ncbi:MAG: galactose mutarotase [Oscillospiraceae bacterium]|nr:galactose mutarotase [Oscillospiraceae bacterium]
MSAPTLFGKTQSGEDVRLFTIADAQSGIRAEIMEYGAAVRSITLPTAAGELDVAAGYDTLAEYERGSCYFGAAVGRFGNRLGGAQFTVNGVQHRVTANEGGNCLHGGARGMSHVVWRGEQLSQSAVRFTRFSPDGEEGFPGNMTAAVTYTLADSALHVAYEATVDKACPVSLTNHSYFNLAGSGDILSHLLRINAARYTEVDSALIPTGNLPAVSGTPFDFTTAKPIGQDIAADHPQIKIGSGYDHNFCLDGEGMREAAVLSCPENGVTLTLYTDRPALQIYAGGAMPTHASKAGSEHHLYSSIALETQGYPDAPNHPHFPCCILREGEVWQSETVYHFSF